MRKIIVLSLALSLGACTSPWIANEVCDREVPVPTALKVASGIGPLWILAANAAGGEELKQATERRKACMDRQTAAQ